MDINNNYANISAAVNAYQQSAAAVSRIGARNTGRIASRRNTDKVELSGRRAASVSAVRSSAIRSLESSAPVERIAALTAAVREGTYHVPAESIAASILEG